MEGADRTRFGRAAGVNAVGNAAKIVVEGGVGFATGSAALIADAAHSVADLVASLVVSIWGEGRFEGPDADHPHGHARFEPLTALFVGGVIVVLGADLLIESVRTILNGATVTFSPLMLGATAFAMVDMLAVYVYTKRANAGLDSAALRALALDCLNDLYTSVAVLAGIVGIALGAPVLDGAAGAAVSLLVVSQGVTIARENVSYLSGAAAPEGRREAVRETLLGAPRVRGVHDLAVFYDGTELEVEAHVETDGDLSLAQAHDLEEELAESVLALDDVGGVHIHLDPAGIGEWKNGQESSPSA
ncbi:cation transporter [Halobacteriales archaeon QH_10_67_13]|nr:MAG: cation transporter [Halobacteriales archaeon QH_10_67_13]